MEDQDQVLGNVTEHQEATVTQTAQRREDLLLRNATRHHSGFKEELDTKVQTMYGDIGFMQTEDLDQTKDEMLQENARSVSQRNIGMMEMIKARREYRKKRDAAIKRRAEIGEYQTRREEEQNQIEIRYAIRPEWREDLREEWEFVKILEPAEREKAMNELAHGNDTAYADECDKIFLKFEALDLSMFRTQKEEDLFVDFEKKKRIVDAGSVLRKIIVSYRSRSGLINNDRMMKLYALGEFFEQQQDLYFLANEKLMHPQHMLLRDKDLENLSIEDLQTRIARLEQQITQNPDPDSPEVKRAMSVQSYLRILIHEKEMQRAEGVRTYHYGEDPTAHCAAIHEQLKKDNRKIWAENLKTFMIGQKRYNERCDRFFPNEGDWKLNKRIWSGAGLDQRKGSHQSIIDLTYMYLYHKNMTEVMAEENQEEMLAFATEMEKLLHSQKYQPPEEGKEPTEEQKQHYKEDVLTLAPVLRDMTRGFLRQFSVIDDEALYLQFQGVSKMDVPGFGEKMELLARLGVYYTDLKQIAGLNPDVERLALSELSKEELQLLQKASFFAENLGGCMESLGNGLEKSTNIDPDTPLAPEAMTEEYLEQTGLVDGQEFEMGDKKVYFGSAFEMVTMYFGSFFSVDLMNRMQARDPDGPQPFEVTTEMGFYSTMRGTRGLPREQSFQMIKDDCRIDYDRLRDQKMSVSFLSFGSEKILFNQMGTIDPPEGFLG